MTTLANIDQMTWAVDFILNAGLTTIGIGICLIALVWGFRLVEAWKGEET
jgi:hypothetical protein